MLLTFRFLQVGALSWLPFLAGQEGTDSEQAPDVKVSLSEEPWSCRSGMRSPGPQSGAGASGEGIPIHKAFSVCWQLGSLRATSWLWITWQPWQHCQVPREGGAQPPPRLPPGPGPFTAPVGMALGLSNTRHTSGPGGTWEGVGSRCGLGKWLQKGMRKPGGPWAGTTRTADLGFFC